jgi:hypothetical protein
MKMGLFFAVALTDLSRSAIGRAGAAAAPGSYCDSIRPRPASLRAALVWAAESPGRLVRGSALRNRCVPLHAQLPLTPQDLADAARCSEKWDHVRPRKPVLIHEVPDQFRRARRSPAPLSLLVASDQARLRCSSGVQITKELLLAGRLV